MRGLGIPNDASPKERVRLTLTELRTRARSNVANITRQLAELPGLHTNERERPEVEANTLLILDNVDRAELLSAGQAAQLFAEPWLKIIVTTRESPDSFGIGASSLASIPVDDLPPEDALALIRDYRAIDDPAEAAAAREIVRRIGGFTLAVELVAAYLAANETTGLTVAGYLARLDQEGITSTDLLAGDKPTINQIRYEREKQIAILVDQMTASLSPAAREALGFASLLPPDQIVTNWLRALTATLHSEVAEDPKPGYPNQWAGVVRELTGRRLLLAATKGTAAGANVPPLLRLHRMVGEHLVRRMPVAQCTARIEAIVTMVDQFAGAFEHGWRENPGWLWYLAPLEATVELLMIDQPDRRELAMAAGIASQAELSTGSMLRGERLLRACHDAMARALDAHPDDAETARLISTVTTDLGDFYVRRGQEGDADRALKAFEEALQTRQRLFEANPTSAAAARDVSVSLNKLDDFYVRRGQEGDADRALKAFEESHLTLKRLFEANPTSAAAARDVSVSLNKLGDFYVRRGQEGDADRALKAFEESHLTLKRLFEANPTSAAAARDVSVSHWMLARLYGQANNVGEMQRHLGACFGILDGFHRDRRPMDPQMRQLHAQLSKMLGGGAESDGQPATREAIPEELVRHVFADPRADGLLRQVMADNGLTGAPGDLPFETQRAMVAALVRAGVIQVGS